MKKLWDKIVEQAGSVIGTGGVMGAAIYSTERNIRENRKNQAATNEQIDNLRKLVEEQRLEAERIRLEAERIRLEAAEKDKKLDEILDNLDKYQKIANESFKNETPELSTNLVSEHDSNKVLNNDTFNSTNVIKESNLFDLKVLHTNESINYPFYASFSTAFMLASYATLSALMGLITNYYTKLYGDKYVDKAPKRLLPIINFYFKLVQHSNTYYYVIIMISQVLIMLGCIYMKFRGIA